MLLLRVFEVDMLKVDAWRECVEFVMCDSGTIVVRWELLWLGVSDSAEADDAIRLELLPGYG